jgi:hypothetical protein
VTPRPVALTFGGVLAALFVGAVLFKFHDVFWWPVDEGVYAYVAQRLLAGDRLHVDLIDLHGGYGNLLNALAFRIFGEDLLSLRYPLVALTVFQCAVAFFLLASRGALVAAAGAVGVAAFSFVQFLNPSSNWHALALFFAMAFVLVSMRSDGPKRLVLVGFLLALCFFTRQLTGIFLALGAMSALLLERDGSQGSRGPALILGGVMFAGLAGYIATKESAFAFFWAGFWPLGLIVIAALRVRLPWREALRIGGWLLAGFALGSLPLTLYFAASGALTAWLHDILFTALIISEQDFIGRASFLGLLQIALHNLLTGAGLVPFISALAWILLIAMIPAVGMLTLIDVAERRQPGPVPILASFWSLVAVHFQIPIYLFFALPAATLALLALRPRRVIAAVVILLSFWAVAFQAGQPLSRGIPGIVAGSSGEAQIPSGLPRVSLSIAESDAVAFREIVTTIAEEARPDEPLMTIPMEPELNFITGRESPVNYYGTPLGLTGEEDLSRTLEALDTAAPLFVVNRRSDKYLTPLSARLLEFVRSRSMPPRTIGPFDLFRYPGQAHPPAAPTPAR